MADVLDTIHPPFILPHSPQGLQGQSGASLVCLQTMAWKKAGNGSVDCSLVVVLAKRLVWVACRPHHKGFRATQCQSGLPWPIVPQHAALVGEQRLHYCMARRWGEDKGGSVGWSDMSNTCFEVSRNV